MAFYFALLNVSTKRDDRSASSSSHRQKRRRHSIASIESPILDYRLLPRPQLVGNGTYHADTEAESSSRQHERRSASHSRISNETSRRGQDVRRITKRNPKEIKYKKMKKSNSTHFSSRKQKHKGENGLAKEFEKLNIASSSASKRDDCEKHRAMKVNETAEASTSRILDSTLKTAPKMNYNKWKAKRPMVVKRRTSPQESSTSDSRRSSNMSNRSPPRNDSLVSSNSSTRVGETIPEASPSNHTLSSAITQKLSNSSTTSKMSDLPRSSTLKKVTFENDVSHLFVNSSFLGDRRVLIRRSSGSTIHRPSITQPPSPSVVPVTLRPLAEGTATLAGLAYGAALWEPFSPTNGETPKRQNAANDAIEETSRQTGIRSLLRRHSTSDRHILYGFQNEGFRLANDETPQAELHKTSSGATLVSFTG